jgi:hypothetical protein
MLEDTAVVVKAFPILRLIGHLLDVAHSFVKLNAEQEAAWEVVRSLVDNPPI